MPNRHLHKVVAGAAGIHSANGPAGLREGIVRLFNDATTIEGQAVTRAGRVRSAEKGAESA